MYIKTKCEGNRVFTIHVKFEKKIDKVNVSLIWYESQLGERLEVPNL